MDKLLQFGELVADGPGVHLYGDARLVAVDLGYRADIAVVDVFVVVVLYLHNFVALFEDTFEPLYGGALAGVEYLLQLKVEPLGACLLYTSRQHGRACNFKR